jgi:hypothetical protein
MKTIIIIGNGKVDTDYSALVEASDFVVRFNQANYYNQNNGVKTDALCITNTGAPARQFAKYKTLNNLPFIKNVKQIWFPRPASYYPAQFWFKPFDRETFERANYERHIISRNDLSNKEIVRFTQELHKAACEDLAITPESAYIPSTGYLGLKYVLQQHPYQKAKIILIGFGFSGNNIHHWENEKNAVTAMQNLNMIHLLK